MLPSAETQQRLEFLDAARGAAAILVLLEHVLHLCFPEYREFSRVNIVIGQAGVLVFFMISGFVVPMSLVQGRSVATFWLRRSFRLLPIYWLSIGLAFVYLAVGGPRPLAVQLSDTSTWLANLALLQKCLSRPDVWGVFWSLHFEIALYVVFSALHAFGLVHRIGTRTFFALLACFAVTFAVGPAILARSPGNGDTRLVMLAAMFGLIAQRYVAQQLTRAAFYWLVASMVAVVVVIGVANQAALPAVTTWGQLLRCLIVLGAACAFFVCLLETRQRRLPRAFVWLGLRSYPIYLLHPFVLVLLTPLALPIWLFIPGTVAATLAFAALAHRLIEKPGIQLGRWLNYRPKTARTTAATPVATRQAA